MATNYGGGMGPGLVPNWAEMTKECLLDIFSRLSQEERWMGPMLVCKTWMNTCHEPSLNTIFDLETRFQSFPESINWWAPEFEDKVDAFLRSVVDLSEGGLTEIRVRHCTDQSLSYAVERCPKLEVLWIKSCPHVTDESMAKIATNCPNLRELDVSYSYCVSHESLSMLGRHCQNLEILKRNLFPRQGPNVSTIVAPVDYILAFPRYGNIEAHIIAKHMPKLKHLELQNCTMAVKGLTSICKGCSDLEYMDLSGCLALTNSDITRLTWSLKSLMEIKKPDFNRPVDILCIPRNDN